MPAVGDDTFRDRVERLREAERVRRALHRRLAEAVGLESTLRQQVELARRVASAVPEPPRCGWCGAELAAGSSCSEHEDVELLWEELHER